jgi:sugar lactone lactonase YvrE
MVLIDRTMPPEVYARATFDQGVSDILDLSNVQRLPGKHTRLFGAVWHPDQYLLVADLGRDVLWFWSPGTAPKVYRRPAGGPTSVALDPAGRLLVIEKLCSTVTRTEQDGAVVILLDFEKLGSNVDVLSVTGDEEGNLYVAIRGETVAGFGSPKTTSLRLLQPDKKVEPFGHEVASPLALTWCPSTASLWVLSADRGTVWQLRRSDPSGCWDAQPILRLWDQWDGELEQGGIAVRPDGLVAAAAEPGLFLFRTSGDLIGRIELPESPCHCFWGGPGGPGELIVTAGCCVYRLPPAGRP